MFFNKISRRTTYMILLVIGCNFFMFKKCGSGGAPPPPGPGAPTGHNNNTPISVNPSEYNNHLAALGNNGMIGGVSCLYDAGLNQSILVQVKYKDANGVDHVFSTASLTQTSLTSTGGNINLNGIDIPTDGEFWIEASITLDCTVCCDKTAILSAVGHDPAFSNAGGCDFNPASPPPPPNQTLGRGQPVIQMQSEVYTATAGIYTDSNNTPVTSLTWSVRSIDCTCNC